MQPKGRKDSAFFIGTPSLLSRGYRGAKSRFRAKKHLRRWEKDNGHISDLRRAPLEPGSKKERGQRNRRRIKDGVRTQNKKLEGGEDIDAFFLGQRRIPPKGDIRSWGEKSEVGYLPLTVRFVARTQEAGLFLSKGRAR